MIKNAFLFDTNKCVGCMACVAGCSIENGTSIGINWRVVNGYNKLKHPDLPVFHFSLACNHCEEALCMQNCPALAYSRDEKTGAVIHHAELCIGCKYCTWACPYNAPKFNVKTHVVEKCNFCLDRISNGSKPACAVACPVGALDFGQIEAGKDVVIPGFVNRSIKPSIHLVPLRDEHSIPTIWNSDAGLVSPDLFYNELPEHQSKIQIKKEWTLVPFTLTVAVLVGWLTAGVTAGIHILPELFIGFGAMAILLSSLHLGKKSRAWRSILNLRNSWLSREIFSFSAFLGLGIIYLASGNPGFGYSAVLAGIACLVSVDMVYKITERIEKQPLHSAMAGLTGIMIWSLLFESTFFIAFSITIKSGLYLFRKINFYSLKQRTSHIFTFLRLGFLGIPIALWFTGFEFNSLITLVVILSGELIDRIEFYKEIDIVTPERELNDLIKL